MYKFSGAKSSIVTKLRKSILMGHQQNRFKSKIGQN